MRGAYSFRSATSPAPIWNLHLGLPAAPSILPFVFQRTLPFPNSYPDCPGGSQLPFQWRWKHATTASGSASFRHQRLPGLAGDRFLGCPRSFLCPVGTGNTATRPTLAPRSRRPDRISVTGEQEKEKCRVDRLEKQQFRTLEFSGEIRLTPSVVCGITQH
jgi:hypothetical protein